MKKKRKKKNKFKKIFVILFILIILFGFIYYYFIFNNKNIEVNLIDDLNFDVNSEVKISDIITEIVSGKLLDSDSMLDTSKVGKKVVNIKIKKDNDKIEDYSFYVNIVDREKPIIECDDVINIYVNDEINLLDFVSVTDNYDENLDIELVGEYDNTKVGKYNLQYVVKDSSNNESIKDFVLNVNELKIRRMSDKSIKTDKGYTLTIKNGVAYVDGILIANKTYYLPEDFVPIDSYNSNITDNCPTCLSKEVMQAFNEMKSDMSNLGLNIWIASGYRSYNTQKYLYNNYVLRDGKAAADTYSARAGHSEHQTGLCFDLNSVSDAFTYTDEGKWVNDNCYLYGFIIRYPYGKDDVTGYMYESWHLRYVGKDLAKKLYNNGNWITLEEYFGITSKYEE